MKTLLLGTNNNLTSDAYIKFNLDKSVLVTSADQEFNVGHTSRQEFLSDKELETVLSKADVVYWTFPDILEFNDKEEYYVTLNWIKDYQLKYKNIKNFEDIEFDPYRWNISLPKLSINDAVFLGCSFTAGVALPGDKSNRYAEIVAKALGKNCINLAQPGGSNNKLIDIFGQLDFVEGQMVVLQLTGLERLRYIDNNKNPVDIMFSAMHNPRDFLKIYNKDFLFYELLVKIRMVITIAREKKLKFLFWLNDYKNLEIYSLEDQMYFYAYPEFVPKSLMENYLVDFGTDNLHPGIESNKIIADVITNYIKQIYEI
jgi:hypothetical protein